MLGDKFPIDPAILIAGIGLPDDDDVEYSEMIVDQIPKELADAARDVFEARSVVFANLLNSETTVRQRQLQAIAQNEGEATIQDTLRLLPLVNGLLPRYRLPVFEILQGTLTGMSPEQFDSFRKSVDILVDADNRVDLFEFFLRHHLIVHLDRRYGRVSPPRVVFKSIEPLRNEACQLLAILVRIGHDDENEARKAFLASNMAMGVDWSDSLSPSLESVTYQSLEISLQKLNTAAPRVKKQFLTAAAIAITHDGQVTVNEAELFRAMSESLDCPVPPVVATIDRE